MGVLITPRFKYIKRNMKLFSTTRITIVAYCVTHLML